MKGYIFSTGGVPQYIQTNSTPCWPSEAKKSPPAGQAKQQQYPLLAKRRYNSNPCWPSDKATTAPPVGQMKQQNHPLLAK